MLALFVDAARRDVVPAADSLSCSCKKVSKEARPALRSPLAFGKGFPGLPNEQAPGRNSLRSPPVRFGQTVCPSQFT